MIADERCKQLREEMTSESEHLTIKISVYLEKLAKKEKEIRMLYSQLQELKGSSHSLEELRMQIHTYKRQVEEYHTFRSHHMGDHCDRDTHGECRKKEEDLRWQLKLASER